MKHINVIDSHTGGEPTRVILDGFPDLGTGTMSERKQILSEKFDHYRTATMLEPRGSDVLVGALYCTPVNPSASAGVIFFNNTGYLGMCGHGTIGLINSLAHLGMISSGTHIIETPVGDVEATLYEDGAVSIKNVASYRYKKNVEFTVPNYGKVIGDIAWGGNWFFLINNHSLELNLSNLKQLQHYAESVKKGLLDNNITGRDGAEIDHIELFTKSEHADSKNFVLCPGNAYDRSPCGTGTSAKVACLADENLLEEGDYWTQESIIGSKFVASYSKINEAIIPTIRGQAFVTSTAKIIIDENDTYAWGITL